MNLFFKFFIPFVIALAGGILTFLIGNEVGMGSAGASIFAGCWAGVATALSYEWGKNDGFKVANIVPELLGGVIGGVLGGIMLTIG